MRQIYQNRYHETPWKSYEFEIRLNDEMTTKHRNVEPRKINHEFRENSVCKVKFSEENCGSCFKLAVAPLLFSFWFALILFPTKIGLILGIEGNTFNESLRNSSINYEKLSNGSTLSIVENVNENRTDVVLMKLNGSMTSIDLRPIDHFPELKDTCLGTNELQELEAALLGYNSLMCQIQPRDDDKGDEERQQNERVQLTYPSLDEFKNISWLERSGNSPRELVNITQRLEPDGTTYNYASESKGAKVVAHNKEAKGASHVLVKDHDKYLRNPCSVEGKFLVIELADEVLVDAVKLANFEHHSSNLKEFELSGSLSYPTETWDSLGTYVASNFKHSQCFKLSDPKWIRYMKVSLLSHYGSEFYCTLSLVEVYGVDAVEQMLEDFIVASEESSTNTQPNPTTIVTDVTSPAQVSINLEVEGASHIVVEAGRKEVDAMKEEQKLNSDELKKTTTVSSSSSSHGPSVKTRQHQNNRLHADTAIKVLLQKVRSLELNLSMLEEYIKELNKRQGGVLPMLDQELSKFSLLMEKSKAEMKTLLEWKESMEKGIVDIESWRSAVTTQVDLLATENGVLRSEVQKVSNHQASLENKELAMLAVCTFFACFALLMLISDMIVKVFRAPTSAGSNFQSRGWTLILISCGATMLIPLIY